MHDKISASQIKKVISEPKSSCITSDSRKNQLQCKLSGKECCRDSRGLAGHPYTAAPEGIIKQPVGSSRE